MAPASIAGDNRTFLPEQISSLRPNAYTLHRHYEAKRQILIALSGRVKPADQFGQSFIRIHCCSLQQSRQPTPLPSGYLSPERLPGKKAVANSMHARSAPPWTDSHAPRGGNLRLRYRSLLPPLLHSLQKQSSKTCAAISLLPNRIKIRSSATIEKRLPLVSTASPLPVGLPSSALVTGGCITERLWAAERSRLALLHE